MSATMLKSASPARIPLDQVHDDSSVARAGLTWRRETRAAAKAIVLPRQPKDSPQALLILEFCNKRLVIVVPPLGTICRSRSIRQSDARGSATIMPRK